MTNFGWKAANDPVCSKLDELKFSFKLSSGDLFF